MTLIICLAAGLTFQGAAGWQPGNVFSIAGNSNGMGATSVSSCSTRGCIWMTE